MDGCGSDEGEDSVVDLVAAAHASADPWQCHAALRRLEARMSGRCGGADGRTHNGAAMQLLAERVESGASPWFLFDVAALLCRLAAPPRVIEGVPDSSEDVSLDDHVLLASDEGAVGAGRLAAALCTAAAGSHCWHAMERALKAVALLLRVADDGALAGAGAGRVFALRLAARDGLAAALGVDTPLDDPCAAICARRAVKLGVRVSQVLSEGDMLWPVARQRAEQVLHASAAPSSPGGHPPLHGLHRGACVRAALEVLFAAHARGSAGEVDSIAAALSAVCRGLAPSTLARELLYADAALLCSARRACELAQADPALAERMAWTAGAWVAEVLDAVDCSPAAVLDWALENVEALRLLAEAARHDTLAVPAHRAGDMRACLAEVASRLRTAGRAHAAARVVDRVVDRIAPAPAG